MSKNFKYAHINFLLLIILFLAVCSYFLFTKKSIADKPKILSSCPVRISEGGHKDSSEFHYHFWLKIIQDGKSIHIPANLGIAGDCIRPIHTHDDSGRIHIDYPAKVSFTLGDFFDVLGQIFNDTQIGSLKTADGYKIQVRVKGRKINNNFRDIVLKNEQDIDIIISSPR